MRSTSILASKILLGISITVFLASTAAVSQRILNPSASIGPSAQNSAEVISQSDEIKISKSSPNDGAVLGAVDKSKCASDREYLKAISHTRPDIELYFGTDKQRVMTSTVLSCASTTTVETSQEKCQEFSINLDVNCVEKLLISSVVFPEQIESIRNQDTGKTVTARIKDEVVDYSNLAKQVVELYQKNSNYETVTGMYATVLPLTMQVPVIKNTPNTDGKLANRYLEFDGSRQLMFMWEKGEYKRFRMSGAFPEYNPVGVYSIMNKSPLAWSSTANKWMPYWQAFTYDKKQRAMLGIHALIYWYPGLEKTGTKKIYEPESNIGKPRSTGCLRLLIEDAKRVYEWTKVGDMVIVHD